MTFTSPEADEACFLLPVVDDRIHLIKRGTQLHYGHWSMVGGKAEPRAPRQQHHMSVPYLIEKMGGHKVLSVNDGIRENKGLEYNYETATREACEELHSNKKYPEDFSPEDFAHPTRFGPLRDHYKTSRGEGEAHLYFFMAKLQRRDFYPSKREVLAFEPLERVPIGEPMVPITRAILLNLKIMLQEGVPFKNQQEYDLDRLKTELARPDLHLDRDEIERFNQRGCLVGINCYRVLTNPDYDIEWP